MGFDVWGLPARMGDGLLGMEASRFGVWANFGLGFADLRPGVKNSGPVFAILVRASRIWHWASRNLVRLRGFSLRILQSKPV